MRVVTDGARGCLQGKGLNLTLLALLLIVQDASAASPKKDEPASLITVTLSASRPRPTAGSGLMVAADVTNVSPKPVYFNQRSITLTLPPELEGPLQDIQARYGWFPTEKAPEPDTWSSRIVLKPGDSYRVFWTHVVDKEKFKGSRSLAWKLCTHLSAADLCAEIANQIGFMFFSPGEYEITVEAKYWTDSHMSADDYRTTFESKMLSVDSPQAVILFGAGVGGLIAYFIFGRKHQKLVVEVNPTMPWWRYYGLRILAEVVGLVTSVVFSTLVTILLSRISEAKFLVQISVTDVWGGIAMGFIANYGGSRVLERLLPTGGSAGADPSDSAPSRGAGQVLELEGGTTQG